MFIISYFVVTLKHNDILRACVLMYYSHIEGKDYTSLTVKCTGFTSQITFRIIVIWENTAESKSLKSTLFPR